MATASKRTWIARVAGGSAVVLTFFFGTLFYLNSTDATARAALRVEHAKLIQAALERYHAAHGTYPAPFPDNPVDDLKPTLVDTGYLRSIPHDPLPGHSYRYTTAGRTNGQSY